MSTIEELQQVCAEFSQNFAALTVKHEALGRELEAERSMRKKVESQLAAAVEEIKHYADAVKIQKESTEEAYQYKERYYATCVAVEHLKGRLEVAKKALTEKDEEHEAEKEHLHAQMNDLLQRIDSNSADTQIKTLKDRIVQLEEQCALLSGSTLEERERVMQQQIMSNASVRDLQSKVATAEQRYRSAEGEIAQLRGLLRRCSDIQAELTTSNERWESENNRLKIALEDKINDAHTWEKRCAEHSRTAEEQLLNAQRQADKTIKQLRIEISSLKELLDRKTEEFDRSSEKLAEFRTSMSKRTNAVREECHREIELLQAGKSDAVAEAQRLKWKLTQDANRYSDMEAMLALAQQRSEGLEKSLQELAAQVEAAAQREGFVAAERDTLKQTVSALQLKLSELQSQLAAKDTSLAEAERLRLQLQYTEAELFETRKQMQAAVDKCRACEVECEKKIKFMHKQIKAQERKRTSEMTQNDELRKRIAAETIYSAPTRNVAASQAQPSESRPLDVLDTLRQQSQQAALLQQRLSALAR